MGCAPLQASCPDHQSVASYHPVGSRTSETQALNRDGCAMKRQLHLNLFIHSRGHHEASWRHPASSPLPLTDIRYYQDLAQRAEAALFDSIFLADQLALGDDVAQARAHLARADHRAGGGGGGDQPDRADRHRVDHLYRAVQSGAAVRLDRPHQQRPRRPGTSSPPGWRPRRATTAAPARSATPTAMPAARSSWRWSRRCGTAGPRTRWSTTGPAGAMRSADRIRPINHRGDYYQVAGPLNLPRCPQGRPVLVQAGSSDTGRRFAARHAEAVFTAHMEKATAQEFYADLKRLVAAEGRLPEQVLILPGLSPMIAVHRGRGAAPGARGQRACPIPRSGASGCPAGSAGMISRTCRSIAR